MRPEYPHDMLSHSADVARNNEARPPDPMKYDGTSYHAGISTLAKSRSPSRTEKTSQAPLHTLLTTAEEISITNIRGSSPPFAIDGRERLSQGRSGNFSRKSPPASSPAASAGPRALQPPTGPRNLAASGTWGRSSGRGTYNSTLKGRDPAIHGEGFGTSGTGGSSYRPAPLPPSAPKAERAVQLPSGPRALRGGYQAPTRGAFRDRAKYEGESTSLYLHVVRLKRFVQAYHPLPHRWHETKAGLREVEEEEEYLTEVTGQGNELLPILLETSSVRIGVFSHGSNVYSFQRALMLVVLCSLLGSGTGHEMSKSGPSHKYTG